MIEPEGCDKCGPGVRAFVYVEMGSGLPLTYCGHCGTLYWDEIHKQGGRVAVDMRHSITA